MRATIAIGFAVGLGTAIPACNGTRDGVPSDSGATAGPTFTRVQDEILTPSCGLVTCHDSGATGTGTTGTSLVLVGDAVYASLVDAPVAELPGETLVVPGDSASSYIVAKVNGDAGIFGGPMPPPFGGLDPQLVELLVDWIDAGAEEN